MQPCGSQPENKHRHVGNAVPAIINAHKKWQNSSVFVFMAQNLHIHKRAGGEVSKEISPETGEGSALDGSGFFIRQRDAM